MSAKIAKNQLLLNIEQNKFLGVICNFKNIK